MPKSGLEIRPFSVFSYLEGLYDRPGTVGFKLMYSHLRMHPEIWAYLCGHRICTVHLVRLNYLDVVVSLKLAEIRQKAQYLQGQEPKSFQAYLDPECLLQRMKSRRRHIALFRRSVRWCRLPHIEVAYEDLVRDPLDFEPIWSFLSIKPEGHTPRSNAIKARRAAHAGVIANCDEVRKALLGTAFAELIE